MRSDTKKHYPFRDVVLIADYLDVSLPGDVPAYLRQDLEMTSEATLQTLLSTFAELGLQVHHYRDPKALGWNAERHVNDLVLSIYGGQGSRNRMALVPAICEANGLRYIGPDVYGRIICQDKEVSKNLARECGIEAPLHRIVRRLDDLGVVDYFPKPFVVKPVMEGSSIGIGPHSLIHEGEDGADIARRLLQEFKQPVLIEAFVGGREVSYNCIEAEPENLWSYSEIHVEGRDGYFNSHLFDADEKLHRRLPRRVHTIDQELDDEDRKRLNKLLTMIGRFGYCRIDGKHNEGRFVFIEITPDAWIGPTGALAASFMNKDWSYANVIEAILFSATLNPQDQ